jgi:hypothetical protein
MAQTLLNTNLMECYWRLACNPVMITQGAFITKYFEI